MRHLKQFIDWMLIRDKEQEPDIAIAQFHELRRQMPLLYVLIIVNAVAVAYTHYGRAPDWLTIWALIPLLGLCTGRLAVYITRKDWKTDIERAKRKLRRTILLAGLFSAVYIVWSLSLAQYGDAYERVHVAFFVSITVVGCFMCLTYLPQAALLVMVNVSIPYMIYYIGRHEPIFLAIALNLFLICLVMLRVLFNEYNGFIKLVRSQTKLSEKQKETVRLSRENARLAHTDPLTSLPNRRYFFTLVNYEIEKSRTSGETFAVGVLDLDHFKPVNDSYGHKLGDQLLSDVGERLKNLESSEITACRLGGDEFGLIVRSQCADVEKIGQKICGTISEPYLLDDTWIKIGGSCGFAIFPDVGQTAHELFDRADYALYNSKRMLRGGVTLYSASHEAHIRSERAIETALENADLEAETSVEFQPIVRLRDNSIVAFEALARWDSPSVGSVPPDRFIPIAEHCGMMHRMTLSLFQKSLNEIASMPDHVGLSFNLSAHDITSDQTVLSLITAIRQATIDPKRVTFEITESSVVKNFEQAEKSMRMLRTFGTHLALDDFGTGYSCRSCLHKLPIDKVKVDRSFVSGLTQAGHSIVESILALCENMGLEGIMEGVEAETQLQVLRSLDCQYAQGYLLGKPMSADDARRCIVGMRTHVEAFA